MLGCEYLSPLQRLVPCGDLLSGPEGVMEQSGQREVSDQLSRLLPGSLPAISLGLGVLILEIESILLPSLQLGKVEGFVIGSGPMPLGGWVLSRYALVLHGCPLS